MHPGNLVHLLQLLANQWRSPESVTRLQERKLRKIVRHAATEVPFYRELFRENRIQAGDIRTLADLKGFPIVSKRDLQTVHLSDRMASRIDIAKCRPQTTSGSTGVPLTVYFRRKDETILNLGWVRAFLAAGLRPWEKRAVFTPKREIIRSPSWYEYLGLMRRLDISTWIPPSEWVGTIRGWRPDAIMGYVKVMQLLADTVEAQQAQGIAPRLVFTTSEVLDEASRAHLRSVLGGRHCNIYASAEAGCIAWECESCSALHISSDTVILELLKDGRSALPGEAGEVVVTNLHSYAMPFIRYRQGDLATFSVEKASCGRGFPLLETLQGREDDCVVLRSGRTVSYSPFYYSVQSAPGVRRWRVIQEDLDTLRVEVEASAAFDRAAEEAVKVSLREVIGVEMTIRIDRLDSISVDPTRKFRAVSSKVRRT